MLGPTEVSDAGRLLALGGQRQRALLTILLLGANQPVSRDALVDRLWGDHPPAGAQHALEVYVSRLRKVLEPPAEDHVLLAAAPVVLPQPGQFVALSGRMESPRGLTIAEILLSPAHRRLNHHLTEGSHPLILIRLSRPVPP